MSLPSILYLENDSDHAHSVKNALEKHLADREVILSHSFRHFRESLQNRHPALVLAGSSCPAADILRSLQYVHETHPHLPIVLTDDRQESQASPAKQERLKEGGTVDGHSRLVTAVEKAVRAGETTRSRPVLEQRLQQLQRMEAIATLAGGIAHDFNNILASMIGYAEMAHADVDPKSRTARDIVKVIRSGQRAKKLIKQILAFSRQHEQHLQPISIVAGLKESIKMLRATLPANIEIVQRIDSNCGEILADPASMQQVIMNICTNAYYAMRDQEEGTLTVLLYPREIAFGNQPAGVDLKPGVYLCLEVGDTGEGISPAIMDKIFTPYFTTKGRKEGTGLGLSVVHGIATSYGGDVHVSSSPGEGTTIRVFVPQLSPADSQEEDWFAMEVPAARTPARIMLVDDEIHILEIWRRQLEKLDYDVNPFLSSMEALAVFREDPDQYDLVITDMAMPRMTGRELSCKLREIRDDIPIVICTGFSETLDEKSELALGIQAILYKPVPRAQLAKTVRDVLDGKDSRC